jgi:glycerol-3-phosphate acyltransferase PlsY
MLSGYVGLATMTAAIAVPVWLAVTRLPADQALFIYSATMAGFIVYWHRSNIERMRRGEEDRNTNLMFLRRKGRVPGDG